MKTRLTADHLAQLEALRRAYGEDLPQKVRAIEEEAAALRDPVLHPEALEAAYHLVHRLNGSSAVYGFEAVHQVAAELDRLLASVREARAADGWREELAAHLEELRRALPARLPEGDRG